jgi:hypothetical protein
VTTINGEIVWVTYLYNGKPIYIITSTKLRDEYYLYKVENGKYVKTKYKNKDPTELEKYMKEGIK